MYLINRNRGESLWFSHGGVYALATVIALVMNRGITWGQTPAPQPARAVQLPLSARQSAGITVQQSAAPPPGSSVNTINLRFRYRVDIAAAFLGKTRLPVRSH